MNAKPTVLVVEDDELIREIVCDVLDDPEFAVVSVGSTQSAMEILDADDDIVAAFLDVDLGDRRGGGYEVARYARRLHPELKVIYTSGGGRPDHEAERVTDSAFMQKPYPPSRLLALIQDAVHEARR
jgi:DNA-binding NtrC family response regulator